MRASVEMTAMHGAAAHGQAAGSSDLKKRRSTAAAKPAGAGSSPAPADRPGALQQLLQGWRALREVEVARNNNAAHIDHTIEELEREGGRAAAGDCNVVDEEEVRLAQQMQRRGKSAAAAEEEEEGTMASHRVANSAEKAVAKFARADDLRAWMEIGKSAAAWGLLYLLLCHGYVAVVPLLGLSYTRFFILFHDMAHHSFFRQLRWNQIGARLCGLWLMTPYEMWKMGHNQHHAIYGREDVWDTGQTILFTSAQYEAMVWPVWLVVRLIREPLCWFLVFPAVKWLIVDPLRALVAGKFFSRPNFERMAGMALQVALARASGHPLAYFLALCVSMSAGVVLFHLQHAVNRGYRACSPKRKWVKQVAALEGSTWVDVPWPLSFFTVGIEFHHIHHLNTRVPGYRMHECHHSVPEEFWTKEYQVTRVGGALAMTSMWNTMYDEENEVYVPFNYWPWGRSSSADKSEEGELGDDVSAAAE